MYINEVTIIGNLTRDPELKVLQSGVKICNFSVATNRTWKDKQGNKNEEVEFHNITSFGRQAEIIDQYMNKGSQIYIKGRLKTNSWENKEGKKQYRTDIILENFQFGYNKNKANSTQVKTEVKTEPSKLDKQFDYPIENIDASEIPF